MSHGDRSGDSNEDATSGSNSMEDIESEHEEIEELLEGLLIFPNQNGLRKVSKRLRALFEHEERWMQDSGSSNSAYEAHATSKTKILELVDREMNGSIKLKEDCCTSN